MEKIYMENHNNNNHNKKASKSLLTNTSVMLSIVFGIFAIISLVAVGLTRTSFAIPDENVSQFPDKMVTGDEDDQSYVIVGKGTSSTKQITLHRTSTGKYIYCIESEVDIDGNTEYTKDKEITDKGLLFLLNYLTSDSYQLVNKNDDSAIAEKAKGWIIQSAIWVYQYEVNAANSRGTFMDAAAITAFRNETDLRVKDDMTMASIINVGGKIYDNVKVKDSGLADADSTVTGLIAKAKNIHAGTDNWNVFSISVNAKSSNVSLTEDSKYYQTDKVVVNASDGGFKGFKIDLSKAPEGTIIVDKQLNEISGDKLDNLATGTEFYVRVPVDKITEDNKDVYVGVTGAFEGDIAYSYVHTDRQTVAYTGKLTKHVKDGISLEINYTPEVPDTSFTTAQSVYFIGLIILLAGVGIIYANIKPSKANQ